MNPHTNSRLQSPIVDTSPQARISEIAEIMVRGIQRLYAKENPQNSQILLASQISPSTDNASSMSYNQFQIGYNQTSSPNTNSASYL